MVHGYPPAHPKTSSVICLDLREAMSSQPVYPTTSLPLLLTRGGGAAMGGHRRCKGTWFSDLPNPELMPRHQWPITSTFNEILTGCGDWNGSRHVGEGIELVVHGYPPAHPKTSTVICLDLREAMSSQPVYPTTSLPLLLTRGCSNGSHWRCYNSKGEEGMCGEGRQ